MLECGRTSPKLEDFRMMRSSAFGILIESALMWATVNFLLNEMLRSTMNNAPRLATMLSTFRGFRRVVEFSAAVSPYVEFSAIFSACGQERRGSNVVQI